MLTIAEIQKRIEPICKRYGAGRVYLFGSYARGSAGEESDVDLRVELGDIHDLFTLSGFRLDLVDALGMDVDIVTGELSAMTADFRESLQKDEVLLYGA